jgi:predicted O-linked N-acetylglucosamine transferase (SPINDLY family)
MRETLKKSPVCDTQQFARNMEALYNELSRNPK